MSGKPKKPMPPSKAKPAVRAQGAPKVFDVMRPGRAIASSTSRPVIVGHKPTVKDSLIAEPKPPAKPSPQVSAQPSTQSPAAAKTSRARLNDDAFDQSSTLMDHSRKANLQPAASHPPAEPPTPDPNPAPAPKPVSNEPTPVRVTTQTALADAALQSLVKELGPAPQPQGPANSAPSTSVTTASPAKSPADDVLADTAAPSIDMSRAVVSARLGKQHHPLRLMFILLTLFLVAALAVLVAAFWPFHP